MTVDEIIGLVHERDNCLTRLAEINVILGALGSLGQGTSPILALAPVALAQPAVADEEPDADPKPLGGRKKGGRQVKGYVGKNGKGWRWTFAHAGKRHTGRTVPSKTEAEAGLAAALVEHGIARAPAEKPAADDEDEPALAVPVKAATRHEPPTSVSHQASLASYLSDLRVLGAADMLSREEEQLLAREYVKTHDPRIAERLVRANLRLVVMVAKQFTNQSHRMEDLIQEGNIGLMRAVEKFDPTRGVKLSSYSVHWIKAYIMKYTLHNARLVRFGTTQAQRKMFYRLRSERAKLERHGPVDSQQLATALGVEVGELEEMELRLDGGEISLDAPAKVSHEQAGTVSDYFAADATQEPHALAERAEIIRDVQHKLAYYATTLDARRGDILRLRLLSRSATLIEIAERWGVTRERVRQVEVKFKEELREWLVDQMDLSSLESA